MRTLRLIARKLTLPQRYRGHVQVVGHFQNETSRRIFRVDMQCVRTGFQRADMRVETVVNRGRKNACRNPANACAGRIKQIVFRQRGGEDFRLHSAQMLKRLAVELDQ